MLELNKVFGLKRRCGYGSRRVSAVAIGLVLFLSAGALATAPPVPFPPFDLPGEESPFPAVGNQGDPAIARGDDLFLVVWVDERTSFFDASGEAGSAKDVYAARLDADGNLIDTAPIVVNQDAGDQYDPVVVWNGENWLVIFTGSVPYGPAQIHTIEAARVSSAGEVLDPDPILIWTQGDNNERLLAAASDGQDWALVIVDYYIQGLGTRVRLVGRRITPDGTLLSAPYYLFSPACCYFFYHGGLAYADGVYMAVFEGYVSGSEYGIFGLRLSPNLQTLDSYPVVITQIAMQGETQYYRTPNVVSNGSQFFVGWQLYQSGVSSQVYGARVNTAGQSLDGNGIPISGFLPLSLNLSPDLAWDGTQWVAGWIDGGLNLARIDPAGNVLDPGGIALPGIAAGAFDGIGSGGLQLVWSDDRAGGPTPQDVFLAPVSSDLDVGPDQCVALGTPSQTQADLAAGTNGSMLVYCSNISGETRIMARPLDSNGEATTAEPVQLAAGAVDGPRVAFDGIRYLAVWSDADAGTILGLRLAEDGTVLDGSDIAVLEGTQPDVAGHDGQFLVTASQVAGVYGARVSGEGSVIDTPPLLLGSGANHGPRTVALGMFWLVTWENLGPPDGSEITSAVVDLNGTVIGPFDVTVPGDGLSHHKPAVAAGDSALIIWQDSRAGAGDRNLYGRRMSSSITFLDPPTGMAITTAAGNQGDAAVAWDGVRFLTAFTDDRNVVNELDVRTDIYRNWITQYGLVDEPDGLPLYNASVPEIDPAVSSLDGNSLYAASVFTSAAPHVTYRIWLRLGALATGVDDPQGELPRVARLISVYPNPANPAVKIRFTLPRESTARVDIYDLQGARMRTLQSTELGPGQHELHWDGRAANGQAVPSGTYLFRLSVGEVQETGKLMLVR